MQPVSPLIFPAAAVFLPAVLLATASDADREFLTQIYLDYRNLIYRVALTFFPDDRCEAEDAFSNTLEKLCRRPELLRSIADAQKASYIAVITANTCRDILRRKKRSIYAYSLEDGSMDWAADPADPYENLFEYGTMEEVLDEWQTLTDKDRDIIRMRYAEEKTIPEMAALLNVRESSIYSALFRARKHLTEHLRKEKNHHEE